MNSNNKKITIYQVAEEAGVAISTVSRVLNNSPNVSDRTKQKVNKAIKHLNFRPQVSARKLASRKPQMLAIAVPSFTTPFFTEILKGVKDQIQELDLDIIIYNTGSRKPEEAVESFFDRGTADAIIAISIEINDNVHHQIQVSGIPTVLIGATHPSYSFFDLSDKQGGHLAAEHLVRQGFQTIGMISPAIDTRSSVQRSTGFIEALKEHSVSVQERFLIRGDSTKHGGFTEEAGYEAILRFHERGTFPDAIFCLNDTLAIGAIHALNELNMKVPDDVAIMGYDNIKFSRYLDLTTINQQMHKVGVMAMRHLSDLLQKPDSKPQQVKMEPELIQRNSTRNPKQ